MSKKKTHRSSRIYLGVDIGGTKVQASVVRESGEIVAREKVAAPREGSSDDVVAAVEKCIDDALVRAEVDRKALAAIGVGVPGVVDPDRGAVVWAPNLRLSDVELGPMLEARFGTPIVLGNDANLGALGETWLGAARNAQSSLYICVGTGIGSGLVLRGKLWRGARESAGEIGHMLMQIGLPKCGCGGNGCLESLASRTAIERDLREAIAAGRPSAITELAGGDLSVIRSSVIRKALALGDEVTIEVVRRAAETIGHACVNVRHLIDPEAIVLGGGLIGACSDFILPIIEEVVRQDPLPGAREGGRVLLSALGDDAVVLGAVAAARRLVGRSPFKKRYFFKPKYPTINGIDSGEITIDGKTYCRDIRISVSGQVKKRDEELARRLYGSSHIVGPRELEKVCKGGPEVLFVGAGRTGKVVLTGDARRWLEQRSIQCELHPTPQAIEGYNRSPHRKAALMHVTC